MPFLHALSQGNETEHEQLQMAKYCTQTKMNNDTWHCDSDTLCHLQIDPRPVRHSLRQTLCR